MSSQPQAKSHSISSLMRADLLYILSSKLAAFIPTNLDDVTHYSIPNEARTRSPGSAPASPGGPSALARRLAVAVKRKLFTLGPDVIASSADGMSKERGGGGAPFPSGPLGSLTVASHTLALADEIRPWLAKCTRAQQQAVDTIHAEGGFKSLEDYGRKLYTGVGKFENVTLSKRGPYEGLVEKGGEDECFALERLSLQPYTLRRLSAPSGGDFATHDAVLPFAVEDATVYQLTDGEASSLLELLRASLLYYVDYRFLTQERLSEQQSEQQGRYTAATDAFFFVHPATKAFLPLAIRTHAIGASGAAAPALYTPLDQKAHWQLAKLVFNQNDLWWSQIYHLAATHEILDLVLAKAIRSFSVHHPVFAFLVRTCRKVFGIRPAFNEFLIPPGGPIDSISPFASGTAARFASDLWKREKLEEGGGGARFLSSRRYYDLEQRGLVVPLASDTGDGDEVEEEEANDKGNGGVGSPRAGGQLPLFPYFEDTAALYHEIIQVLEAFVHSLYPTDTAVCGDEELQTFVQELNETANTQQEGKKVHPDFPRSLNTVDLVVQFLCHVVFLSAIKHNVMNGSGPSQGHGVLPWHPAAFYWPIPATPEAKVKDGPASMDDLRKWLPGVEKACEQVRLMCAFNRPGYKGTDADLVHLFAPLTKHVCRAERFVKAEAAYRAAMLKRSQVVQARKLGDDGKCEGLPFAWTLLDPQSMPGYAAI